MTEASPALPLAHLFDVLRESGYTDAHLGNQRPGGPNRLRLVKGDMSVRASLRANEWVLELNCRAWGGEWFDAAVVRAVFDHESAAVPDDPDTLSAFVLGLTPGLIER